MFSRYDLFPAAVLETYQAQYSSNIILTICFFRKMALDILLA